MTTTTTDLLSTVDLETLAWHVNGDVLVHGGSTVKISDPGAIIDSGWAVSLPDAECIVPLADFGPDAVKTYVREHAEQISAPGVHLGAWLDTKTSLVYLDLSAIVEDRLTAEIIGVQNEQLAIFNLATGETVRLS
jgi:hypothetical protein